MHSSSSSSHSSAVANISQESITCIVLVKSHYSFIERHHLVCEISFLIHFPSLLLILSFTFLSVWKFDIVRFRGFYLWDLNITLFHSRDESPIQCYQLRRDVLLSAIGRLLLPALDFGTVYLLTSGLPRHSQHFVGSWKLIYFGNLTQTLCYNYVAIVVLEVTLT